MMMCSSISLLVLLKTLTGPDYMHTFLLYNKYHLLVDHIIVVVDIPQPHSQASTPTFCRLPYCKRLGIPMNTYSAYTVGAAYEGVKKRTFLAMSIMISLQVPVVLTLLLLYRKLGRMKEKVQAQVGSTAAPVSSETSPGEKEPSPGEKEPSPGEKEPSLSDEEDATEMSGLLHTEEKK